MNDRAEQVRRNVLFKKYGLTPEQFHQLETLSDGKCAICNEVAKLNVDHDHATGEVRGLLCRSCNIALGLMKDNVFILISAIEYLGGVEEKQTAYSRVSRGFRLKISGRDSCTSNEKSANTI
jgi:hypothetical protein